MPLPPRPLSLQAQAETDANERHSRRLAELKTLAPLLAQLDALMPSFTARGLKVYPDNIGLTHHYTGERRLKVLRLNVGTFWDKSRPAQWQSALITAGFSTLKHNEAGQYSTAVMRRGALLIEIDAPTLGPVNLAAPAAEEAVPA